MIKLLKEEELIVYCLQEFVVLEKAQLFALLKSKNVEVVERIINGLLKKGVIKINDEDYVYLADGFEPDFDLIKAFWVFTDFVGNINLGSFYRATEPNVIAFLKKNTIYNIVVITKDTRSWLKVIRDKNESITNEENKCKYIIIVDSQDTLNNCIPLVDGVDVAFAILTYNSTSPVPNIEYKTR